MITKVLYLAAITAILTAAARAVTVVNSSFEDLSASYVDIPGADRMNAVAADGWSVAFNTPDWGWGEGPAGLWNTPFGERFALAAATGFSGAAYREGISQTVSGFTVGETYDIDFSHTNGLYFNPGTGLYEGVGTVGGWQVLIDGSSVLVTSSTNDNSVAALDHTSDWQSSTATFTATSTSHELVFAAWRPGDGSQDQNVTFQFLDDVQVTRVPEPSTTLLAAFAGLGLLRRRRA